MIAIVFAAGVGSRLKPFTDFHPKALAPVGGVPALVRVTDKLRAAGARRIIVNIHHFPDQIRKCLESLPYASDIEISDESDRLLDTAGALAKIWRENDTVRTADSDEPIVIHNADIVTDFDIRRMIDAGTSAGADATILVDPGRNSSRRFLFDSVMRLRGWVNETKNIILPQGLETSGLMKAAFGGVHVITPRVVEAISRSLGAVVEPQSITPWYIANAGQFKIVGYTPPGQFRWHDIGTPEKLAAADADFLQN